MTWITAQNLLTLMGMGLIVAKMTVMTLMQTLSRSSETESSTDCMTDADSDGYGDMAPTNESGTDCGIE